MAREVPNSNSFKGLKESDLNPEAKLLLDEIRKTYQENKIKERVAKAARKRRYRIRSAFLFPVFICLVMILHFSGLLKLIGLSDIIFLLMG